MDEAEEIDVIIPVYRPDEKLHRLLLALERQTVKPSRILLVNTEREFFDDACVTRHGACGGHPHPEK